MSRAADSGGTPLTAPVSSAGPGGPGGLPPPRWRSTGAALGRTLYRWFPPARLARICVALAGIDAAAAVALWLGERGFYSLPFAATILPQLFSGFEVSAEAIALVIPLGFGVGFLIGWGRTSRSVLLRGFGAMYVDFFRSMPPIVLIFFASLIGLLGLNYLTSDPYLAHTVGLWFGAVALGLHTAAYQAEIVRAGILSVPAGQTEATDSIGLSRTQSMFLVVLPQAFRVSLPALGNEFSSVIKDTSLLSLIGWLEITGSGYNELFPSLHYGLQGPLILWIEVAIFYFILTFLLTSAVRSLENVSRVPGLEAAQS
ncbi:MAG: amino acid ABC transporter permease [Thermoplasmata archaeon]|nr:amino acid ABC transporter permease [Thermoplasmata archaeon]